MAESKTENKVTHYQPVHNYENHRMYGPPKPINCKCFLSKLKITKWMTRLCAIQITQLEGSGSQTNWLMCNGYISSVWAGLLVVGWMRLAHSN
jgi:hypothetical protein